ncbi:MAG: hypothetical protein AB1442_09895 [Nitrospirota bacterium]
MNIDNGLFAKDSCLDRLSVTCATVVFSAKAAFPCAMAVTATDLTWCGI